MLVLFYLSKSQHSALLLSLFEVYDVSIYDYMDKIISCKELQTADKTYNFQLWPSIHRCKLNKANSSSLMTNTCDQHVCEILISLMTGCSLRCGVTCNKVTLKEASVFSFPSVGLIVKHSNTPSYTQTHFKCADAEYWLLAACLQIFVMWNIWKLRNITA